MGNLVLTLMALIFGLILLIAGIKSFIAGKTPNLSIYSRIFNDVLNPKVKEPLKDYYFFTGTGAKVVSILYIVLGIGLLLYAVGPFFRNF